jgi:hypothetical protein
LRKLFAAYGEVKALRLPMKTGASAGQHRGFAFVEYLTVEEAQVRRDGCNFVFSLFRFSFFVFRFVFFFFFFLQFSFVDLVLWLVSVVLFVSLLVC